MTSKELADMKEEELRQKISLLPIEAKKAFYAVVTSKIKDPDTYAVLNWFCIAGLHHFYLHKFLRGFINIILGTISIIGLIESISISYGTGILISFVIMLSIFLIELPQLFAAQRIVQEYNNSIIEETLKTL